MVLPDRFFFCWAKFRSHVVCCQEQLGRGWRSGIDFTVVVKLEDSVWETYAALSKLTSLRFMTRHPIPGPQQCVKQWPFALCFKMLGPCSIYCWGPGIPKVSDTSNIPNDLGSYSGLEICFKTTSCFGTPEWGA